LSSESSIQHPLTPFHVLKGEESFMASVTTQEPQAQFGQTSRTDYWWVGPLAVFVGLSIFLVYSTWAGLQGRFFEIREEPSPDHFGRIATAPYLSPFYSPLLYDASSPHRWFNAALSGAPRWWPEGWPFSAAVLILWGPGLFRFTCYYYRKAYYRAFWADPPACAVGEPRKSYWGENHWPLLLQNVHRYTMYLAVIFLVFLWYDALYSFYWPKLNAAQTEVVSHTFGFGLGTFIMLANVVLLTGFTLGCNSLRHLSGGRLNHFACFTCPKNGGQASEKLRPSYKFWRLSTRFNEHHMLWAWLSLFSVGFTDLYIRLCAMDIWTDPHITF
jgi:hypothetical protein